MHRLQQLAWLSVARGCGFAALAIFTFMIGLSGDMPAAFKAGGILTLIVSLVLLGCLGTGIAYVWNQNTVRAWGPTRASTVTYITPVVGVILGILILGETISWNEPLGALVVFLGILLAQDRLRAGRRGRAEGAAAAAPAPSISR